MILPDANLLLYAYDSSSPNHDKAKAWWEHVLNDRHPVLLCWPVVGAFLRISTNPRLLKSPFPLNEAVSIVEEWLGRSCVQVVGPGASYWKLLQKMIAEGQARGPLISDAQLAAQALEQGARLASTDQDFARFPSLQWHNPLKD